MDVVAYLRKGPRTAEELAKMLAVSKKTLYKRVNRLIRDQKILVFPMRAGTTRWLSLFALPEHSGLASSITGYTLVGDMTGLEPRIISTIEVLRDKLLRNPEINEIIREMGENPENRTLRDAIYHVGTKAKWVPPTQREMSHAEQELSRILKLAAWMRRGRLKGELARGMSKEEIEKAKRYLEKFPELVPEK